MAKKMQKNVSEKVGFKGIYRLNIVEDHDGKKVVVGDSGWHTNMLTNLGVQYFIISPMIATAASSLVGFAALGSGGTVASTVTTLPAECVGSGAASTAGRFAVAGAVSASRTLRFTGSLQSNVINQATTIGNIGLFAVSTASGGSMFAGNTFSSSALATNQAVNVTYDIQFP